MISFSSLPVNSFGRLDWALFANVPSLFDFFMIQCIVDLFLFTIPAISLYDLPSSCNRNIISLHIFVSDFLVFILNTIVYTFTLLLLKRYPSIKWTYQYFHLAMMFTFGAKEDEKLSFYHSVEYFCEILIMSVSNKCIITPVYIIFFLFNFFHSQFVQFGHLVEFFNCCLPYIIESFSNFTDVILTPSCHYRCRVVLTN